MAPLWEAISSAWSRAELQSICIWSVKCKNRTLRSPDPDVTSGRVSIGVRSPSDLVYQIFKRKRAKEFLEFLKYLLKQSDLVMDNFKIHDTKAIRSFRKENKKRLRIVWLPPYSPYLNLIERFWKHMKASPTARQTEPVGLGHPVWRGCTVRNYFFGDATKLIQALHCFFRRYHRSAPGGHASINFQRPKLRKAS